MLEVDINDNIDSLEVIEDDSEEGRGLFLDLSLNMESLSNKRKLITLQLTLSYSYVPKLLILLFI